MKRLHIINIITFLISFLFFIFIYSDSASFHRPWHDGPSCDGCHCEPTQECSYDPEEGCSCTYPEVEED